MQVTEGKVSLSIYLRKVKVFVLDLERNNSAVSTGEKVRLS